MSHATIYSHNWPPDYLYVSDGWVAYAPYWPGDGLNPAGYYAPENSAMPTTGAPDWWRSMNPDAVYPDDGVRTFLELRNTGSGAVTVTVHANPTTPYTYTAPAGQTLKVGPFILYASNGGFGFRCTPATGVQARVLKDAAPAGLGIVARADAPPSTTYLNP